MREAPAYAYVEIEAWNKFRQYSGAWGLSSSELLKLLIRREMLHKRLQAAAGRQQIRQVRVRERRKVTAYLDPALGGEFITYAEGLGLATSHAAALLVEVELTEKWLERAIREPPNEG